MRNSLLPRHGFGCILPLSGLGAIPPKGARLLRLPWSFLFLAVFVWPVFAEQNHWLFAPDCELRAGCERRGPQGSRAGKGRRFPQGG